MFGRTLCFWRRLSTEFKRGVWGRCLCVRSSPTFIRGLTIRNRLSYFYDRLEPLGLPLPFTLSTLRTLSIAVCAGPLSPLWSRFHNLPLAMSELEGRPESCLDLNFMLGLLGFGYELEEERAVFIGKKVGDVELGWLVLPFLTGLALILE